GQQAPFGRLGSIPPSAGPGGHHGFGVAAAAVGAGGGVFVPAGAAALAGARVHSQGPDEQTGDLVRPAEGALHVPCGVVHVFAAVPLSNPGGAPAQPALIWFDPLTLANVSSDLGLGLTLGGGWWSGAAAFLA